MTEDDSYKNKIERYIQDLLNAGTFGKTADEIIERFLCEGIERAIANKVIGRRRDP